MLTLKVLTAVKLLQSLSHPNLVAYRHIWLEDVTLSRFGPSVPCAFVLQQYCNSGDLLHYIIGPDVPLSKEQLKDKMRRRSRGLPDEKIPRKASFPKLSFEEIYSFSKDMTSGLAYLHSSHYIHRDLKPSNILLHKDDKEFRCLLSDFGEIQPENAIGLPNFAMFSGTLSYCAPELLKQDDSGRYGTYTTKSDIFSLGMIIYFMCYGTLPYTAANKEEGGIDVDILREEILSWPGLQDGAAARNARPDLPLRFVALLKVLLAIDPTDRPSAKEALDVFGKA
jgi:serine/threonine protein kinase